MSVRPGGTTSGTTRRPRRCVLVALALLGALALSSLAGPPAGAQDPGGDEAAPTEPAPSAGDDACAALAGETFTVATKAAEPFVFVTPGKDPSGFSIELWQLITSHLGVSTRYLVVDTVPELLDQVGDGQVDAANAAISITADRHQVVDFSTPTYTSGLRVMVSPQDGTSFGDAVGAVFETYLLWVALGFAALVLVAGTVVWLIERRHNPQFHRGLSGIGEGMWWAVVTMFTVGYGDRVARTGWGRVFSAMWIMLGIVLVAQFTATITARLTIDELTSAPTSLDELVDDRVVTVRDTAAADLLTQRGIPAVLVGSVDEMVDEVAEGRADAAVYDGPILERRAQLDRRLEVVGDPLTLDYYGIALPQGSPNVECIDRALAQVVEDGSWQRLHDAWFGA